MWVDLSRMKIFLHLPYPSEAPSLTKWHQCQWDLCLGKDFTDIPGFVSQMARHSTDFAGKQQCHYKARIIASNTSFSRKRVFLWVEELWGDFRVFWAILAFAMVKVSNVPLMIVERSSSRRMVYLGVTCQQTSPDISIFWPISSYLSQVMDHSSGNGEWAMPAEWFAQSLL